VFAGSVYYVDATNGNDANPGTESLPWQTMQKAANTTVAGDSVIVKAGTYNERVLENSSGSSDSPITYQANPGHTVICRGFTLSGNYIIIDGFDIDSETDNSITGVGVYVSSDYVTIKNCYIYQCPWGGVKCTSNSTYCTIQNNEFYYNGQYGIWISGNHHLVQNNEISHTVQYHSQGGPSEGDADGILFFGSHHTMRWNFIHSIDPNDPEQVDPHIDAFQTYGYGYGGANNCTIEKNYIVLPYDWAAWIQLEDADYLTIRNNITDCYYMAASEGGSHSNSYLTIVNNTILGRLNYYSSGYPAGINVWNTNGSVIKNNITINFKSYQSSEAHHIYLYNNTNLQNDNNCTYNTDGSDCPGDPGVQPNDLWKTNPEFVDFEGGDYHLKSESPCIDSGAALSNVTDDYDGNLRPQGAGYDIGAFEYSIKYDLTIDTSTGGSTNPSPGEYSHPAGTAVQIKAIPYNGYIFKNWSGSSSETTTLITIIMNSDKYVKANFLKEELITEQKGSCFIATAAYNSPSHPYVVILRDFRDKYLMHSKQGRNFIYTYYKYSPFFANLIANHKLLKIAIRISILPLVAFSYSMVHFGLMITLAIVISTFALQFFSIFLLRRKIKKITIIEPSRN